MARNILLTWIYQADEEILTCGVQYNDETTSPQLRFQDLVDLTAAFNLLVVASGVDSSLANDFTHWGCHASSPEIGGSGPSQFYNPQTEVFERGTTMPAPDSVVANITLRGSDSLGRPVSGGIRLSGMNKDSFDGNNFDDVVTVNLKAALEIMFPPNHFIGGVQYYRSIFSESSLRPPEFVRATTLDISPRVGVRIDRVGNRTTKRTEPV